MKQDEIKDREAKAFIREGQKLQVKEVLAKEFRKVTGGQFSETLMHTVINSIDEIYHGSSK